MLKPKFNQHFICACILVSVYSCIHYKFIAITKYVEIFFIRDSTNKISKLISVHRTKMNIQRIKKIKQKSVRYHIPFLNKLQSIRQYKSFHHECECVGLYVPFDAIESILISYMTKYINKFYIFQIVNIWYYCVCCVSL